MQAWPLRCSRCIRRMRRRSLYTFSKRTAPFAAYAVFDAPSGENCVVRRDRSNTPLQALTLLNDEMYVEMSRALANEATSRALSEGKTLEFIFCRLLTRPPEDEELSAILKFFQAQLKRLETGELQMGEITGEISSDDLLESIFSRFCIGK